MPVYVRFDVASEVYAIAIANAFEVAALGQVVAVPRAPAPVLGIQVLHGEILPVVDTAAVLRLERDTPPSRLLVAQVGDQRVGLAVDDVTGVTELAGPAEEAESPVLLGSVLADGALIGIIDVARAIGSVTAEEAGSMRVVPP